MASDSRVGRGVQNYPKKSDVIGEKLSDKVVGKGGPKSPKIVGRHLWTFPKTKQVLKKQT